ncbi:FHA domain-containing protein [Allobaculum mucilyticum]|uniref:FHA domain-containing protein n=1 Tax=Allobaculum mucilyticum TaxID=2834459 RepID=UPI001E2E5743|nr:FHA domain-containing protein [Allobaculum mucilyticum]UNT95187.1 FHA domain-containing protein [Allobaculum mucilyticum]
MNTMQKNRLLLFGEQFAYSLTDAQNFAQTEYKVINNEKNLNVVSCIRIQFNDQNLLFFLPSGTPLKKAQNSFGVHEYCVVMSHFLAEVIKVQNNGFLNARNIDLSRNRIFIGSESQNVFITYVPCKEHLYSDQNDFDKNLKNLCLQILAENPGLQNKDGLGVREAIKNCPGDADSLYKIVSEAEQKGFIGGNEDPRPSGSGQLLLKSVNAAFNLQFQIRTDRFILGRKADAVNGLIGCSPLVGRVHAVISRSNGQFYISDMKSKNGTFINDIPVHRPTLIRNGDVIRLGNVDFLAQFI